MDKHVYQILAFVFVFIFGVIIGMILSDASNLNLIK